MSEHPDESEWQIVEEREGDGATHRLSVPGGWIYRCYEWGGGDEAFAVAMVFVPDPEAL